MCALVTDRPILVERDARARRLQLHASGSSPDGADLELLKLLAVGGFERCAWLCLNACPTHPVQRVPHVTHPWPYHRPTDHEMALVMRHAGRVDACDKSEYRVRHFGGVFTFPVGQRACMDSVNMHASWPANSSGQRLQSVQYPFKYFTARTVQLEMQSE